MMDIPTKHFTDTKSDGGPLLSTTSGKCANKERGVLANGCATPLELSAPPTKRCAKRGLWTGYWWNGSSSTSTTTTATATTNSLTTTTSSTTTTREGGSARLPSFSLTKCERPQRRPDRKRGESSSSYLKLFSTPDDSTNDGKLTPRPSSDTTTTRYSSEGGTASILSCTINLANTCIGTGMFGLPAAFASSGYALGSILLLTACMFAANGLRLLSMSAEKVGIRSDRPASFYSMASAALPQFTMAIDFAVALKCFGVATSYLITVGDCMVEVIRYFFQNHLDHMDSTAHSAASSFVASRQFWVLSAVIMVIPMSFHGTLDALHCASTLSLCLTYAVATGVILYAEGIFDPCEGKAYPHATAAAAAVSALYGDNTSLGNITHNFSVQHNESPLGLAEQSRRLLQVANETIATAIANNTILSPAAAMSHIAASPCQGDIQAWNDARSTLRNVAIFVFSFCCHQNLFPVLNEIKDRTQRRVDSVVTSAMCSAFLLYFVVAIEGYLTFGNLVSGDILLSYPETAPVTVMRLAIAVMVILSYPLQLDPSRRSILSLLRVMRECWDRRRRTKDELRGDNDNHYHHHHPNSVDDEDELGCSLHATGNRLAAAAEGNVRSRTRLETMRTNTVVVDALEKAIMIPKSELQQQHQAPEVFTKTEEKILFNAITCVFLAMSLGLAMVVQDLGIVLAVVGATGSTMISYILPGLIYIRLHPEFTWMKGLAMFQLFIGCLITPTALYFVIFGGVSH